MLCRHWLSTGVLITTQMQLPAIENLACNDVQMMICSASAIHCCNVCVMQYHTTSTAVVAALYVGLRWCMAQEQVCTGAAQPIILQPLCSCLKPRTEANNSVNLRNSGCSQSHGYNAHFKRQQAELQQHAAPKQAA
jgi:hypothetical protein